MKSIVALMLLLMSLPAAAESSAECPLKGKWLFDPQRESATAATEEERRRVLKQGPFIREYTCTTKRGYFPDDDPAEIEWEPYQIKSNSNGVLVLPVPPHDLKHYIVLEGNCFWFSTSLSNAKHRYCRVP